MCLARRFRLSGMKRVAEGVSPELRAARRASLPLSIFFRFVFLIGASAGFASLLPLRMHGIVPLKRRCCLEAEGHLQVHPAICAGAATAAKTTREAIRFAKQG